MYCGQDWDPIDANETDIFSMDFRNDVNPGEGIVSASWSIGVSYGNDPVPSMRLVGNPGVLGTITSQTLTTAQSGVIYWLAALIVTTTGRRLELWGHVPCVIPM